LVRRRVTVDKKEWRKPEVKTLDAGAAEKGGTVGDGQGSAKS
jgi:hypothetical protein